MKLESLPKDFIGVPMTVLNKNPKSTKSSHHSTISLTAHTAKTVARIFKRTERKIDDVPGEGQFGFRRGKRYRKKIGILRIISE